MNGRLARAALALLLGAAATVHAADGPGMAPCSEEGRIAWPAGDPAWELCVIPPAQSTGSDGAGLEIVDVRFRGLPVLARAGLPILDVAYDACDACGCGPCYRDWTNEPVVSDLWDPDHVPPDGSSYSTCDVTVPCPAPNRPCGVSIEDRGDELVLSAIMMAGWYRYVQSWTFGLDGTLDASLTYTAVTDPCTFERHVHHGQWRIDVDLGVPGDDVVRELASKRPGLPPHARTLRVEESASRDAARGRSWRVVAGKGRESRTWLDVVPHAGDEPAAGPDAWVLLRRDGEHHDAWASPDGCGQAVDGFVDGDTIDSADVVLWLAVKSTHEESCCADHDHCARTGWTLSLHAR